MVGFFSLLQGSEGRHREACRGFEQAPRLGVWCWSVEEWSVEEWRSGCEVVWSGAREASGVIWCGGRCGGTCVVWWVVSDVSTYSSRQWTTNGNFRRWTRLRVSGGLHIRASAVCCDGGFIGGGRSWVPGSPKRWVRVSDGRGGGRSCMVVWKKGVPNSRFADPCESWQPLDGWS